MFLEHAEERNSTSSPLPRAMVLVSNVTRKGQLPSTVTVPACILWIDREVRKEESTGRLYINTWRAFEEPKFLHGWDKVIMICICIK